MSGGTPRLFDVFISYASPDRAWATQLHQELTAQHLEVFIDHRQTEAGDRWDRTILDALRGSRIVACLTSKHASTAYYFQEEIHWAIKLARKDPERRAIVPVRLDDSELPYGLLIRQAVDMRDGPEVAGAMLTKLADRLRGAGDPSPSEEPPEESRHKEREEIFERISRLPSLDELRRRLASHEVSGGASPLPKISSDPVRNAIELVIWADAQDRVGLKGLAIALDELLRRAIFSRLGLIAAALLAAVVACSRALLGFEGPPRGSVVLGALIAAFAASAVLVVVLAKRNRHAASTLAGWVGVAMVVPALVPPLALRRIRNQAPHDIELSGLKLRRGAEITVFGEPSWDTLPPGHQQIRTGILGNDVEVGESRERWKRYMGKLSVLDASGSVAAKGSECSVNVIGAFKIKDISSLSNDFVGNADETELAIRYPHDPADGFPEQLVATFRSMRAALPERLTIDRAGDRDPIAKVTAVLGDDPLQLGPIVVPVGKTANSIDVESPRMKCLREGRSATLWVLPVPPFVSGVEVTHESKQHRVPDGRLCIGERRSPLKLRWKDEVGKVPSPALRLPYSIAPSMTIETQSGTATCLRRETSHDYCLFEASDALIPPGSVRLDGVSPEPFLWKAAGAGQRRWLCLPCRDRFRLMDDSGKSHAVVTANDLLSEDTEAAKVDCPKPGCCFRSDQTTAHIGKCKWIPTPTRVAARSELYRYARAGCPETPQSSDRTKFTVWVCP